MDKKIVIIGAGVAGNSEDQEMNEIKRMIELANIKTFFQ